MLFRKMLFILSMLALAACGRDYAGEEEEEETSSSSGGSRSRTSSGSSSTSSSTSSSSSASRSTEIATVSRPDTLCGEEGYTWLLQEYFFPQCGDCHSNGDFADRDPGVAYPRVLLIEDETMVGIITGGAYCQGDCRLEEGDSMLADIETWQGMKESCP